MTELVFLRPYWLLALIPATYFWWRIKRYQAQQSDWKNWIEPAFQPYLLAQRTSQSSGSNWALTGLAAVWLAAILALSGPSWQTVQLPAQKTNSASVIVLDLSLSMYADDLEPNRLTRVQFKLNDLLEKNPDLRTGLVAYSGSAHIITPISDDNTTLLNLLPYLNPLIMPSYGSDAAAGFELANDLLKSAQINQGHIIWITDDIEPNQHDRIKKLIKQNNLSLSILAVGEQNGGAVKIPEYGLLKDPQDRLVQAPLPLAELQKFSQQVDAKLVRLQLNNRDLEQLKPAYLAEQTKPENSKPISQPLDYGVYLLGFILILAAFSARRGWLLSIGFIALLPGLVMSPPSFAETQHIHQEPEHSTQKPEIKLSDRWREVYLNGNQRGYQAWLNHNYVAAEREFDDPAWQGSALYRQAKYAEAAEAFKKVNTAEGHYNLGNALAKSGDLEAAKQAYQQALEKQPDLKQAQHNLELVKNLLKQQTQQNQTNKSDSDQNKSESNQAESNQTDSAQPQPDPSKNNEESDQANPNSDQVQSNQAESQTSQKNAAASQQASEANTPQPTNDARDTSESKPTEAEQASENSAGQQPSLETPDDNETTQQANQREQKQANQAWLNQIPDQPGLFLKRKFDYQYQQNPPDDPQQNERKIW
ncbi:VWA domain-containing protein [Thiomicrospira sp.]|uniref:VWA domain-containing protein n=1 Tax=Thiomicrospira sp. TaxID=935 RepID=UPI002F91D815